MQPMCKPKAWIFHPFTSYESMRHILKQSLSMAVKRKGEWNHASVREGWVFVGLRFWLEAAPLYWTTTSLLFFPQELWEKYARGLVISAVRDYDESWFQCSVKGELWQEGVCASSPQSSSHQTVKDVVYYKQLNTQQQDATNVGGGKH